MFMDPARELQYHKDNKQTVESYQPELFLWLVLQIHPNILSLKHVLLLPQHPSEERSGDILLLRQMKIYCTRLKGGAPWVLQRTSVFFCRHQLSCRRDLLPQGHQAHGESPGDSKEPASGFCFHHRAVFPLFVCAFDFQAAPELFSGQFRCMFCCCFHAFVPPP